MIGRVTFFDRKKGYGYIAGDDVFKLFFQQKQFEYVIIQYSQRVHGAIYSVYKQPGI